MMKMRVLYDHQIFTEQRCGGVSKYFVELCRSLRESELSDVLLAVSRTDNIHLRDSQLLDSSRHPLFASRLSRYLSLEGRANFPGKGRLVNLFRLLQGKERFDLNLSDLVRSNLDLSIMRLRAGDYDLLHPTYYDPYFLDFRGEKPFVLTVHDMIHELFPAYFPADDQTVLRKRRTIAAASRLIAVSGQTRDDLVRISGIDPALIDVVYHGVSEMTGEPFAVPDNFILFVGSRNIYKNFPMVARAFARLSQRDSALTLVCCGGGDWSAEERQLLRQLDISGRVHLFHPSDRQLAYAYGRARLFVYPSLYEGFGMPILEAARRACPVSASQIGPFTEIAEDSITYFDPHDLDSVIDSLARLLEDQPLRQRLVEQARRRADDFTWEKTARKTAQVYEKLRQ